MATNKYLYSISWCFTDCKVILQEWREIQVWIEEETKKEQKYLCGTELNPRLPLITAKRNKKEVINNSDNASWVWSSDLPAHSLIPWKQIKHTIVLEPFSRDKINQTQGNTIFWQCMPLKITEKTSWKLQLLWLGSQQRRCVFSFCVFFNSFNAIIKVVHTKGDINTMCRNLGREGVSSGEKNLFYCFVLHNTTDLKNTFHI